jgi:hypothetical protein
MNEIKSRMGIDSRNTKKFGEMKVCLYFHLKGLETLNNKVVSAANDESLSVSSKNIDDKLLYQKSLALFTAINFFHRKKFITDKGYLFPSDLQKNLPDSAFNSACLNVEACSIELANLGECLLGWKDAEYMLQVGYPHFKITYKENNSSQVFDVGIEKNNLMVLEAKLIGM